jgi:inorganic pyrophosphatase
MESPASPPPPLDALPLRDPGGDWLAVIEASQGSRHKFKYKAAWRAFELSGVLPLGLSFPYDFGFLPSTLGDDGDPLDVLVLMTIPVFTGCLVNARPIGLFHLVDRGAADEKVLAVPTGDPYSDGLNDLEDVPPHYLKEIEHFFQVYKDLEGTRTETRGFEGAAAAREAILQSMESYSKKFGSR